MPTLGAPELIIVLVLVIVIILGLLFFRRRSSGGAPSVSINHGPESLASQLEKLEELKNRGAISEQEFEAAKRKLLS